MRRPCRRRSDYLRRIGHSRLDLSAFSAGLVGYWTMDKENIVGSSLADLSGEGNTGTIVGAAETDGIVGQALKFDGVDDYVSVAHNTNLNPGLGDFSGGCWIKWKGTVSGTGNIDGIFGKSIGSDRYYMRVTNLGKITVMFFDATHLVISVSTVATDLGWHYIFFTADRDGYLTLYIDGVSTGTPYSLTDISAENLDNLLDFKISIPNLPSLGYFNGSIDEVRIYNRALSVAEIVQYYNATRG